MSVFCAQVLNTCTPYSGVQYSVDNDELFLALGKERARRHNACGVETAPSLSTRQSASKLDPALLVFCP